MTAVHAAMRQAPGRVMSGPEQDLVHVDPRDVEYWQPESRGDLLFNWFD